MSVWVKSTALNQIRQRATDKILMFDLMFYYKWHFLRDKLMFDLLGFLLVTSSYLLKVQYSASQTFIVDMRNLYLYRFLCNYVSVHIILFMNN